MTRDKSFKPLADSLGSDVTRCMPDVLIRFANTIATEDAPDRYEFEDLERWLAADSSRVRALAYVAVTLAYQYNIHPQPLRLWARAIRGASIKGYCGRAE